MITSPICSVSIFSSPILLILSRQCKEKLKNNHDVDILPQPHANDVFLLVNLMEHFKLVLYSLIENVNYSYEAMAMMGSATNVKYTDLSNMIDEICQRYVIF